MYTSILNERIVKWTDAKKLLLMSRMIFEKKKRRTIDHLASLTNIIYTRKKTNNPHSVLSSTSEKLSIPLTKIYFGRSLLILVCLQECQLL
jgi:hypothetical protein